MTSGLTIFLMSGFPIFRKTGIDDKYSKAENHQSNHQCHNEPESTPFYDTKKSNKS